jgi:hypothetical protein
MMSKEPGLAALEAISATLKKTYDTPEDIEWIEHPLAWIRSKPSARIGKIGRLFVMGLCKKANLQVKGVGYALLIGKKKYQVRFSTGWSGGGFKFEQLRFEKYEAVICLGITPQRAYAWVIPQTVIFDTTGTILKKDGLTPQHKGKGGSETAWINVNVQEIPSWMTQYGETISQAVDKLK